MCPADDSCSTGDLRSLPAPSLLWPTSAPRSPLEGHRWLDALSQGPWGSLSLDVSLASHLPHPLLENILASRGLYVPSFPLTFQ